MIHGWRAAALLAAMGAWGCGDDVIIVLPGQILSLSSSSTANLEPNLDWTVPGATTDTETSKSWSCSRPQANVALDLELLAGAVTIVIRDGATQPVASLTFRSAVQLTDLRFPTRPNGTAGVWTATVTPVQATFVLRVKASADTGNLADEISLAAGMVTSAVDWGNVWTWKVSWPASNGEFDFDTVSVVGNLEVRVWNLDAGGQRTTGNEPVILSDGVYVRNANAGPMIVPNAGGGTKEIEVRIQKSASGKSIRIRPS